MHDTGESDYRVADVLGIVERSPVGPLVIAPDGLLEIGALVARAGRVYMIPHIGVSDAHLAILRGEAECAAVDETVHDWQPAGGGLTVTYIYIQSSSSNVSASDTARSTAGARDTAWRFQASA